ncbi:FemAB family protein [uncultured archaeon]|nr:FemAB family protein [uncultured archaeon]
MLVLDKKIIIFNIKEVYFSGKPFDIRGCDSVRFYYCKDEVNLKGFACQRKLTSIIDLTQNLEKIWLDIDGNSSRKRIKIAKEKGIEVKINEDYNQFHTILKSFMRQKRFGSFLLMGELDLLTMKKYGTCLTARYKDEVLGGQLYLEDEENILFRYGASKRLELDKKDINKSKLISDANRLLHWEAIQYAKNKGIKIYNWGGLWPKEDVEKDPQKMGVNLFKLSFGGEVVTRFEYHKIYSKIYNIVYRSFSLY